MTRCGVGVCVAASIFSFVSLTGCGGGGGGSSSGPKTYQVSGTVTQGGKPVQGAPIPFASADGKGGAAGRTDANGQYTLSTSKPGGGAVAGQYKVAITKFEESAATGSASEKGYVPPREGESLPPPKSLLPEKYGKPDSSGLTATVREGGENKFDFSVD